MKEQGPRNSSLNEKSLDGEQFGEIAHARHEIMMNTLERSIHRKKTQQSEREILAEAQKYAREVEDSGKKEPFIKNSEKRRGPISRKQLNESFKMQIKTAESEMTSTERAASKIIHNDFVEKTADILATTLARPNAMLSGSIAAFIGMTVTYFVAKYYGFQISGFEMVGSFVAGWALGLLYDYLSIVLSKNK